MTTTTLPPLKITNEKFHFSFWAGGGMVVVNEQKTSFQNVKPKVR